MENNAEIYQTVLIVPQNEWLLIKAQLKELQNTTNIQKESTQKQIPEEEFNQVLPYDEACKFLGIGKQSLVRAKNKGRIKGFRGFCRGFSYRMGDLIQYKKNFGRRQKGA